MKNKLLLLSMLIPCALFGQQPQYPVYQTLPGIGVIIKKDSLPITKGNGLTSKWTDATQATGRNGFIITGVTTIADTVQSKYDTIRCVMLVCDTSFIPNSTSILYFSQINGYSDTIGYIKNRVPYTWWQFGYEVRGIKDVTEFGYNRLLIYLDENKKPLPKSVIVWMSKQL